MRRVTWIAGLAVVLFHGAAAGETMAATALEAASRMAEDAGLARASCPDVEVGGLPAFFRQDSAGGTQLAEGAALVPVAPRTVRHWLEDLEEVPAWAFLGSDGKPILGSVTLDESRQTGALRLGDEAWEGSFRRERTETAFAIHVELVGGRRVKEAFVELGVLPAGGCAGGSVLTIRVGWRFGLLTRMFGGDLTRIPALFALRLRDDAVGRALLDDPALIARLTSVSLERGPEGDVVLARTVEAGGKPTKWRAGLRIGRVSPSEVRVPPATLDRLREVVAPALAGRAPDPGPFMKSFLDAVEGSHAIVGANLWVTEAGPLQFSGLPARLAYWIDIDVDPQGSRLSLGLDPGLPSPAP